MTQILRHSLISPQQVTALFGAVAAPLLIASPTMAQYYSTNTAAYDRCERRDNTTQVIGGVIGGVVGGLIGHEIDEGAGTVIGAGLGTAAGARLGDRNCDKYNTAAYQPAQPYRTTTYSYPSSTTTYYPSQTTTSYPSSQTRYARTYPVASSHSTYRTVSSYPTTSSRTYYGSSSTSYGSSGYSAPSYTSSTYSTPSYSTRTYSSPAYGSSTVGTSGLVRVTCPQTGAVFHVSQADYDRNYR